MNIFILATVNFGEQPVTQHWRYLDGDPSPYLMVTELEDKKKCVAIRLNRELIRDFEKFKGYFGTLEISEAAVISGTGI